jgi:hypothetical protein
MDLEVARISAPASIFVGIMVVMEIVAHDMAASVRTSSTGFSGCSHLEGFF